jgi:Aspartokinases
MNTVLKIGGSCISTDASISHLEDVWRRWKDSAMVFSAFSGVTGKLYSNYNTSLRIPYAEMLLDNYSRLLQRLGLEDVDESKRKILQINEFRNIEMFQFYIEHSSISEYLSIGERFSASVGYLYLQKFTDVAYVPSHKLGIIMVKRGQKWQIDIEKSSKLVGVEIEKIQDGCVLITTGFFGSDESGHLQTLERNTSDYSAAALSAILKSKLILFKDVDGIYFSDPKMHPSSLPIDHLNYAEALSIVRNCGDIIHPRAIEVAGEYDIDLEIRNYSTFVRGSTITRLPEEVSRSQ